MECIQLPKDLQRIAVPFFYWKRFILYPSSYNQPGLFEYFTFPLDAGYGFVITETLFKSDSPISSLVKIAFVCIMRSREY